MANRLESGLADIATLTSLPRNPKRHDLNTLGRSYQRWGFVDRILASRQTGHLISGHGRVEALLALKASGQLPPEGIETRDGAWLAPVDYVSVPEGEEMALAVALNRTVELGGWDDAALAEVLAGLAGAPGGLDGVGYNEADLEALLASIQAAQPDIREDHPEVISRADELQAKWQVKRGDVFVMGRHRVMCGDSTKGDDVARLMQGKKAVLMATDPPYGDAWVQKARDMQAHGYGHSRAVLYGYIEGDNQSDTDLKSFLDSFLAAAKVAGEPPFPIYVWHGAKRILFEQALLDAGYLVHQPIVWVKPSFVIGRLHYHPRCEWALHGWLRGGGNCPFYGERNQSDVWELGRENDAFHPTQKPVELFAIPIRNHTKLGERCYDPFLGSGTTLIAAEKLGRICYGMEIWPAYVSVCLQRYLNFTGNMPRLIDDR